MRYISTIFKRLFLAEPEKKVLGRWNIEYCDKMLNNKIDLSNEDHCGSCGQYAITKNELKHVNMNTVSDIKNDVTHKKT